MANILKLKKKARVRRKYRSKKRLYGTPDRPRLTVYKSLNQIYAQIVDDQSQKSITGVSSLTKELASLKVNKTEMAGKVGELIAAMAKAKGIESIVFDRSGYLYHGRVKALAEAARKSGLKF
ncbi:MAG: 50S ribosomal protein L18 [candidate division Zixibacteria bacterium]|nr:50S ribosomal protein L18 [candidate division Zixibacteria bacterium]